MAFNPLLVWFSQEARPYALLVLLSGASFLLFAEALERPTGRRLAGWAVVSALALATHYFAGLLILPEALWLLHRIRPRRDALLAVAGFSVVPLALIPLVAAQGQVQDYSFVKGESLATRVVAQVPKQWLVGYDAPAETAAVIVAAALTVVAVWLALTRAEGASAARAAGCRARAGGARRSRSCSRCSAAITTSAATCSPRGCRWRSWPPSASARGAAGAGTVVAAWCCAPCSRSSWCR